MSVLRPRPHGYKPDGTLPLINIVLLLVLAFMMAGTFTEPLPADFDPLRSEAAQPLVDDAAPVILTMDVEGAVTVDGGRFVAETLEGFLSDLAGSDRSMEMRTDARTPAVFVIKFLSSTERAGLENVKIVTLDKL